MKLVELLDSGWNLPQKVGIRGRNDGKNPLLDMCKNLCEQWQAGALG